MSKKIEEALTAGLLNGYAGKTEFGMVARGDFNLQSSILREGGITYVDQWLPRDTGGGQELVRVDKEEFTRLYAGGVIDQEKLASLGIRVEDVIKHLIERISSLGEKTRLFTNCHPDKVGEWGYGYTILEREPEVGAMIAKETITFQDQLVFVHYFLLSQVR
jgi:hypothetical protein